MTYYTVTGNPPTQTRGTSATIRAEFALIAAGFTSAAGDINARGMITGQTWTGTHTFPATTYGVTAAFGSSGTGFATLDYVNAVATNAALPGQASNAGKYMRTNGISASWSELGIKGADVPSSSTIDLSSADGDLRHVTGTTTITAITIPVGAERTVIFDGALTLTNSAALLLPGAANITTAAGDRMVVRGDTAGAIVVSYTQANGRALIVTPYGLSAPLAVLTPTAAANIDALNVFVAAYDNYVIIGDGIKPAADDTLQLRFANAGVVVTSANYGDSPVNGSTVAAATAIAMSTAVTTVAGIGGSFRIDINNVNSATTVKGGQYQHTHQSAATPTYSLINRAFAYTLGAAISGFRLYWNSGNNFAASGTIRVYGYNNT